jgi:hypothetical protein
LLVHELFSGHYLNSYFKYTISTHPALFSKINFTLFFINCKPFFLPTHLLCAAAPEAEKELCGNPFIARSALDFGFVLRLLSAKQSTAQPGALQLKIQLFN